MRVVVIGAGIGGLAATLALRRIGIETLVFERTGSVREVGAGLAIWSNAINALRELGLEDKVMASASVIDRHLVQSSKGRFTLLEALPQDSVRTGVRCAGFQGSAIFLESGERIKADVLVGADGISSVIREGLHGAETPRYAGYTCWRGIRDSIPGLLDENSALLVLGAGSQFGAWPCGSGKLYWFLTKNAPRGTLLELMFGFWSIWCASSTKNNSASAQRAAAPAQGGLRDPPSLIPLCTEACLCCRLFCFAAQCGFRSLQLLPR
jgi:2-polyprenyl-6-methoxyphenol hydroxylase-like FAD-dependent oxidoreductase